MHFRVEAIQPMWGDELRAALEDRRDHWARVTLQDDQDPAYLASEEQIVEARAAANQAQVGLAAGAAPPDFALRLREAVERQANLIALQNQTPGPAMQGAISLINEGIEHAVGLSKAYGGPCRVTLVGEFNTQPNKIHGGYKRIAVMVDDASFG